MKNKIFILFLTLIPLLPVVNANASKIYNKKNHINNIKSSSNHSNKIMNKSNEFTKKTNKYLEKERIPKIEESIFENFEDCELHDKTYDLLRMSSTYEDEESEKYSLSHIIENTNKDKLKRKEMEKKSRYNKRLETSNNQNKENKNKNEKRKIIRIYRHPNIRNSSRENFKNLSNQFKSLNEQIKQKAIKIKRYNENKQKVQIKDYCQKQSIIESLEKDLEDLDKKVKENKRKIAGCRRNKIKNVFRLSPIIEKQNEIGEIIDKINNTALKRKKKYKFYTNKNVENKDLVSSIFLKHQNNKIKNCQKLINKYRELEKCNEGNEFYISVLRKENKNNPKSYDHEKIKKYNEAISNLEIENEELNNTKIDIKEKINNYGNMYFLENNEKIKKYDETISELKIKNEELNNTKIDIKEKINNKRKEKCIDNMYKITVPKKNLNWRYKY